MKKLFGIFALLMLTATANAQETAPAGDDSPDRVKGVRFGLKVFPLFSYAKPADNLYFKNNAFKLRFGYGAALEIKLNKRAYINTGIDISSVAARLEYKTLGDTVYYLFKPEGAVNYSKFYLKKRDLFINYAEVPITVKMKTPEIGAMTYFGIFGTNIGFRTKARANDEGAYPSNGSNIAFNNEKVDVTDQTNLLRMALNVGIGAEYNLVGSTSMVVSVNYNKAYINTLKKTQTDVFQTKYSEIGGVKIPMKAENPQFNAAFNYFALHVGVIF